MKIKPLIKKKKQAKSEIRINVLTKDQLLIERLRSYFKKHSDIFVIFSAIPEAEYLVDCYVVPVHKIRSLFFNENRPKTWLPIIAFGSHIYLKKAFWAVCADFIKEPWDPLELEIRVRNLLKTHLNNYCYDNQELTIKSNICSTANKSVVLSFQESCILKTLLKQRGFVVPREVLFYAIWQKQPKNKSRAVDMHISALRKKLKYLFPNLKQKSLIISARGTGYMLI